MTVELTGRGAAIVRIALAEADGRLTEMVVGPPALAGLIASARRYGAIVGRYAGRLRGSVEIAGQRHDLAVNASGVTLHGGDPGFDRALWSARPFETADTIGVAFTHVSRDGDQGFPGTLSVTARYTLARHADALTLDITATADRPTIANMTNHVYFDLSGGRGLGCQTLTVDAPRRVAIDARKLPTGTLPAVAGTPLDFTRGRALAGVIADGGVDEMLVLGRSRTARLTDRPTGRVLTLTTDQPGLQVFTGNGFDGTDRDRAGRPIVRHAGIALEPGNFSDAPNVRGFPDARVAPGRSYRWRATWHFTREAAQPCR